MGGGFWAFRAGSGLISPKQKECGFGKLIRGSHRVEGLFLGGERECLFSQEFRLLSSESVIWGMPDICPRYLDICPRPLQAAQPY